MSLGLVLRCLVDLPGAKDEHDCGEPEPHGDVEGALAGVGHRSDDSAEDAEQDVADAQGAAPANLCFAVFSAHVISEESAR